MRIYEFKRQARVEEITELIKDLKVSGESVVKKNIIISIMNRYNVSRKTAHEYYDQAVFKNGQT